MSLPLQMGCATSDPDLATRTASGDPEALGQLYQRHGAMLIQLASRLLGSRADGEDVVQDVFVGLPEALSGYRDDGRLTGWLRRVTINHALKRMRTVRRRRETALETASATAAPNETDAGVVRRAVHALPDRLRTVVVLKLVEGYSHEEIGALLGISRGASEVRLSRALRALRTSLGE